MAGHCQQFLSCAVVFRFPNPITLVRPDNSEFTERLSLVHCLENGAHIRVTL